MLPQGTVDQQALDTLSKIVVQSFTATPPDIGPFGESVLRWSVTGPSIGWGLELNGQGVGRAGSMLVHPTESSSFFLTARAREYTRPLSSVDVEVDLSACGLIDPPLNPALQIADWARGLTEHSDPSLYFRDTPKVSFLPERIHIEMKLYKKNTGIWPDPEIDATLEFGLDVQGGQLVSTNPSVTASISKPWYMYLCGLACLGFWIAIGDAQDQAQVGFEHLVEGLPQAIATQYPPGPGREYQSVTIVSDSADDPIQILACPIPRLGPGGILVTTEVLAMAGS